MSFSESVNEPMLTMIDIQYLYISLYIFNDGIRVALAFFVCIFFDKNSYVLPYACA